MASKFYAVKKGKIPGIYNSWDDCKKMVDGFPGAVYKSFKTLEEAEAFVGADASAIVYSIAETALLNGLKPYVYLSYVLNELRKMGPFPKPDDLNRLLPWSNELPEGFRTKKKK